MTSAPKVYRVNDLTRPKGCIFIGRSKKNPTTVGRYGNPFTIPPWSRDEACDHFDEQVLPGLDVSALRGLNLVCFCAPDGGSDGTDHGRGSPYRCHGYSILRKANA